MKRRLYAVMAATLAVVLGGPAAAGAVVGNTMTATGDWGCVVVRTIHQAVCFENPLPERLPIPETPPLPA